VVGNLSQFSDFNLHPSLDKALEKLDFENCTPVQTQAIPPALEGKDLMACASTGSGKTLAFLIPIFNRLLDNPQPNSSTRALIILPTRELALQTQKVADQLAAFSSIKSGLVIGGEPFKYQIASIRRNPEIIIATPGRLVEHIEKKTTDFSDLEVLVLDEADRMLDMGFAEDMEQIIAACNPMRQILLFSATLKHKSIASIEKVLNSPIHIRVDSHRESAGNILQQITLSDGDDHKKRVIAALATDESYNKIFVFCNTRIQCQKLGEHLITKDIKAGFIHSEISQSMRKQILNRFIQGHLKILACTDVAARGLDIPGVDLVVNYNVPRSGNDYIHRIGRTGRGEDEGTSITLVESVEWNLMSSIERYLKIQLEA